MVDLFDPVPTPIRGDPVWSARLRLAEDRVPNVAHAFDDIDARRGRELMVRLLADVATDLDRAEAATIFCTRIARSPHLPLALGPVGPYVIADEGWRSAVNGQIARAPRGTARALLAVFTEVCRYYEAYLVGLRRPARYLGRFPVSTFAAIGRIETVLARQHVDTIDELAGKAQLDFTLLPRDPLPPGYRLDPTALRWVLTRPLPGPPRAYGRPNVGDSDS